MANTSSRSAQRALLPPAVVAFLARRLEELGGLAVMAVGAALAVALATYDPQDPSLNVSNGGTGPVRNLLGLPGSYVADFLVQALGAAGVALVLAPLAWGWRWMTHRKVGPWWLRAFLVMVGTLLLATALTQFAGPAAWARPGSDVPLGGTVGFMAAGLLGSVVGSTAGAVWVTPALALSGAIAVLCLLGAMGMSWAMARRALALALVPFRSLKLGAADAVRRRRLAADVAAAEEGFTAAKRKPKAKPAAPPKLRREPKFEGEAKEPVLAAKRMDEEEDADEIAMPRLGDTDSAPRKATVVRPAAAVERRPAPANAEPAAAHELPPVALLQQADPTQRPAAQDESQLQANAEALESVLSDFGVRGEIGKVHPGPVVTLYELEPAPGTKSSRVIGLADDIARSMSAVSVRVAVVPGRNVIGVELPNRKRETVYLRELLEAAAYRDAQAKLALVLGKDIGGQPVIADLARMPHLLVAGTTGSGKSVAINTMILSLLYRLPPERCRFIMVDPKMLELSVYDGIPHLLAPVVTDPKKAVVALKWTVREMEQRYRAMSKLGVRNIDGYNARLREAREKNEMLTRRVQTGFDPDTGKPIFEDQPLETTELPYIVVIVDEMADLMLVAGKDIEAAIQRLAQMARAAGIHLIMATQRPSVDVITGTIKANFPTRISFQVTSKIDSRTILGEQGAEQLLGQGDMLYMAGGGRITRVHGPFVSDGEVESVVRFLKAQGEPQYVDSITEDEDEFGGGLAEEGGEGGGSGDELYDRAVALVARERKASTSFIQRHLQIGYNRAARIIERMEQEGIVSAANHVGKREVLARGGDDD